MSKVEWNRRKLSKEVANLVGCQCQFWLACSVHPNLGNRDFIHVSIELHLNVSNLNLNLGNRR